jgi:hypothetical protein
MVAFSAHLPLALSLSSAPYAGCLAGATLRDMGVELRPEGAGYVPFRSGAVSRKISPERTEGRVSKLRGPASLKPGRNVLSLRVY